MAKRPRTPEKLFDQMWRPGRPFRPRVSSIRRVAMTLLLALLVVVIAGYVYLTDETRVRHMAENYLGRLVGGPVKIGKAKLSIFQGLQLDDVELYGDDPKQAGALLFTAHSFLLEYSFRSLIHGTIDADRIVAVEPRVYITEDSDTGRRNYAGLIERHRGAARSPDTSSKIPDLPEIVLRNAQITYTREHDGKPIQSSTVAVEGQVTPLPGHNYAFSFQARGSGTDVGPIIAGSLAADRGQLTARLSNFEFGPDVKAMLPPGVRRWWEEHDLSGRVNIPVLSVTMPTTRGGNPGYRVETELEGVTLSVRPQEWLNRDEQKTLETVRGNFKPLAAAGIVAPEFSAALANLIEPTALKLTQVHGKFVFNDDESIGIEGLRGWLVDVPFQVDGQIKGYTAAAAAHIRLASAANQDVTIPVQPGYLTSLPPPVRELYDRFRPQGTCRFWIDVARPAGNGRPSLNGEIDILNSHFAFERFPYPLDGVAGKIRIGKGADGEDRITLENLIGHGMNGGLNEKAVLSVNGAISPLGPDSAVDITARGTGLTADEQLVASFPPLTRDAIGIFSGPGGSKIPDFTGGFECHIVRDRGVESHWTIDTDVHLASAAGRFKPFPYPIDNATGDLLIRDDHLDLRNVRLFHGSTVAELGGAVRWHTSDQIAAGAKPGVREELTINAKDVAWSEDLLNALPPSRRPWLAKLGGAGTLTINGTVNGPTPSDDVGLNLDLALAGGTMWPVDGKPMLSDVSGKFHLSDDRVTIAEATAKRGDAPITLHGQVAFAGDHPIFAIDADAGNLLLDPPLYAQLPADAKSGWEQINPAGTADIRLSYSTDANAHDNVGLTLVPKTMSATPAAAPYRLDNVTGSLKVEGAQVTLSDVTAKHNGAAVRLSGVGNMSTPTQGANWQFKLAGDAVSIDDDLNKALPASIADLAKSAGLKGKVDFDFSSLNVKTPPPTTQRGSPADPDIDFAVTLKTSDASLDVGVPLQNVKGNIDLTGTARKGRLGALTGSFDGESMNVGTRAIRAFHADVLKIADRDQITVGRIQAEMAKGSLAGQIDYTFPQRGASRYLINLVLQNADVRQITGETDQPINGMLSASLALEGVYDKPGSRRGRGDVKVSGQEMYKIPVLLGLLQVTNLALPISEPFTQASAQYGIEANRVTFENIELQAKDMMMQGDGNIDFATKQVRLNFVTDSQNWSKIPLIGAVIEGARHELLQIHVKGTLQEPKVSAGSLYTLTTTVDQVINGDDSARAPKQKKAIGFP